MLAQVLLFVFSICTLNYIILAVLGYLMFGDDVRSQVTMSLPTNKVISKIAIYTTLAIPIVKYALIMTPIANGIENSLPKNWNNKFIFIFIRTLLLISTVVLAIVFPYFDTLMALVGAVLCVIMSILLPCICYLKIFRLYQKCCVEVGIIGCIIVMGVAVGVLGTYTSVKERIKWRIMSSTNGFLVQCCTRSICGNIMVYCHVCDVILIVRIFMITSRV